MLIYWVVYFEVFFFIQHQAMKLHHMCLTLRFSRGLRGKGWTRSRCLGWAWSGNPTHRRRRDRSARIAGSDLLRLQSFETLLGCLMGVGKQAAWSTKHIGWAYHHKFSIAFLSQHLILQPGNTKKPVIPQRLIGCPLLIKKRWAPKQGTAWPCASVSHAEPQKLCQYIDPWATRQI